jgi:hypothetical protein
MATGPDQLHEHGEALAAADERLNRALREADGDENEAYDRLRREDEAARTRQPPTAGAEQCGGG